MFNPIDQILTPLEVAAAKYRNCKQMTEKGLRATIQHIIELKDVLRAMQGSPDVDRLKELLQEQSNKLIALRKRVAASMEDQDLVYDVCRKRIHLHQDREEDSEVIEIKNLNDQNGSKMCEERTEKAKNFKFQSEVVQFLNCRGKIDQSIKYQKQNRIENCFETESQIYSTAFKISKSIVQENLTVLREWCLFNSHTLNKLQNGLYFQLICCEFILKLKENDQRNGLLSLRKELAGLKLSQCQHTQIQKLMLLLLNEDSTNLNQFLSVYIKNINQLFLSSIYKIYHISPESRLDCMIAEGVSSMKTVCCCKADQINPMICPTCEDRVNRFGKNLPMIAKRQSGIKCRINNSLMDQKNYPIALPNGQIYSLSGLTQTEKEGLYYCIATNTYYQKSHARKVFLT